MGIVNVSLVSGAIATGLVAGLTLYGSTQVTSPPRSDHRDDPLSWGLPCETIGFRAADGLPLRGWLARAPLGRGAVIVAHGHGANRHSSLAYASFLFPEYSVLLPDFRAHGESPGQLTSVGYHERKDLIGAVGHLRSLGYQWVGLLGISMGGAAALLAAAECPEVDAVVADSSFAALRHAVREGARMRGYPAPIVRPLAYLSCRTAAWRLRYSMRSGDPITAIARIAPRPLLLIQGEADSFILPEEARALYAAAGDPKELWLLPGVGHARAIEAASARYCERVMDFFSRSMASTARA
jgi:fermentation-respiration switch protein FrsA (DUF1100 family)